MSSFVTNTRYQQRSLSMKGCQYAVAESTLKMSKTEFVKETYFEGLEQLKLDLKGYVDGLIK